MSRRLSTFVTMGLLAVLFFATVLLNHRLFHAVKMDFTDARIYSLSEGSKRILSDIIEPIHIDFYFSEKASEAFPELRQYASRVKRLLREYEQASNGKLVIQWVNPEPFSVNEDNAVAAGLNGVAFTSDTDLIYFGLTARNALDERRVIPFFDQQKERFLEYDISKMLFQLNQQKKIRVGLFSSVNISGGHSRETGEFEAPWHIYSQLETLYELVVLSGEEARIPDNLDVLVLVHPQSISASLRYAIEQFSLSGKGVIAFVDPHFESDALAILEQGSVNRSNMDLLLAGWGVEADLSNVVLDPINGLEVNTFNGPFQHVGLIGLGRDGIEQSDIASAYLELINGGSFGHLSVNSAHQINMQPLLVSSSLSSLAPSADYALLHEPKEIEALMAQHQSSYVLAARFTGKITATVDKSSRLSSASQNAPSGIQSELTEAQAAFFEQENGASIHRQKGLLNLVVVADVDMLADPFWAETSQLYDETVVSAFADNPDFLTNLIEHLGGSAALIEMRSRGTHSRPFTKVEALQLAAEKQFREQESALEQQLREVENALLAIENQPFESGVLMLTQQQEKNLLTYQEKRQSLRQALREVRHQLNNDIESLGMRVKIINIVVAPALLILLLAALVRMNRVTRKKYRD